MNVLQTITAAILLVSTSIMALPYTKDFSESEWTVYNPMCTGAHQMNVDVMDKIQQLRDYMNQPLKLTSAYRCPEHPVESAKTVPGQHSKGLAVDIHVTSGAMAAKIIAYAITHLDVKGFAYSKQSGFVHLDWRAGEMMTWNY